MANFKLLPIVSAASLLAASTALAQTPAPPAASPSPPAATSPSPPEATVPAPASPSALPKTAAEPAGPLAKDVAVGSAVFSSDGKRLGKVDSVKSDPSGTVDEIHVHVGGFLGFGGKTVVVPANKILKTGSSIQVTLSSDDVDKLPVVTGKES